MEAISGACMVLKAETFREVGGFSPEFFMYGEDMDLCAKVRRLGLKVYYVPAARVLHHGGKSTQKHFSQFSTVMMRVSGETYMKLNHGLGAATLYRLLQGISALVRLALLLPVAILCRKSEDEITKASLAKWWTVLKWASGGLRFKRVIDQKIQKGA